jgi:hypothetical protein
MVFFIEVIHYSLYKSGKFILTWQNIWQPGLFYSMLQYIKYNAMDNHVRKFEVRKTS